MEDNEFYEDYELTDEFSVKINELITGEVKSQIKKTVEELESINHEYSLQSIELSVIRNEMRVLNASHEKELKEAVKIAQREYWFDCAVGDKVFILDKKTRTKKCERCGGSNHVSVIADSVEVKAECPVCGTYEKRQKMQYTEYSIVEGIVERLQIELTKDHKWVHLWIRDKEYKYELAYDKIFRTKEECQATLDEAMKKEG
jgi:hypothetical protein